MDIDYKDIENQLKDFWEKEPTKDDGEVVFTIDYFDESMGVLQDRDSPTAIEYAASILRELLVNIKPSHALWDKIKHAAFMLHLATRSRNFVSLYQFYHEMENETGLKNLTWKHKSIQMRLLDMIVEQVDHFAMLDEIKSEALDNSISAAAVEAANNEEIHLDISNDHQDLLHTMEDLGNSVLENGDNDIGLIGLEPSDRPTFIMMSEDESALDKEENASVKDENNEDDKTADKENLFDKKVNSQFDMENNETDILQENIDPSNGEKQPKFKVPKSMPRKKLRKAKRLKLEKDEVVENGGKEKKSYYVRKEKKKKMFQCSSCDYSSDYHSQIDQHTFKHHSSLCTQCGYQSETFKDYQEHAETHPYTCEICKMKFVGIRTLRRHMTIEHQSVNLYTKEKKMVPCHICGKLVGEPSLRGHIKNIHSTEIHKCDYCDFTTNRAMKVRVHMKKHLRPAKPCPECGKLVKSLAQHFRLNCSSTAQKERFPCPICEKTFSKKDGMQKHVRHVHDNVKNILCNFCDYKTNSSFNLRLHISKMHTKEELEVECQFCNIKTRGLEYHLKIYHFQEYQAIKQPTLSPSKVEQLQ